MAGEFQDQFREAMREAEMADLKKDIDEATSKVGGLDPFSDIKEAAEWKPPEPTTEPSTPPAADAPPAPPAEAVMADAALAATETATPAPHADAPQPEPPKPDVMQGDIAPAAPGGDRAA
jgi:sec-independent protein translocase protein TatB